MKVEAAGLTCSCVVVQSLVGFLLLPLKLPHLLTYAPALSACSTCLCPFLNSFLPCPLPRHLYFSMVLFILSGHISLQAVLDIIPHSLFLCLLCLTDVLLCPSFFPAQLWCQERRESMVALLSRLLLTIVAVKLFWHTLWEEKLLGSADSRRQLHSKHKFRMGQESENII